MCDLAAWQYWQQLEFMRMLAEGHDEDPPDGGGTLLKLKWPGFSWPFFVSCFSYCMCVVLCLSMPDTCA